MPPRRCKIEEPLLPLETVVETKGMPLSDSVRRTMMSASSVMKNCSQLGSRQERKKMVITFGTLAMILE